MTSQSSINLETLDRNHNSIDCLFMMIVVSIEPIPGGHFSCIFFICHQPCFVFESLLQGKISIDGVLFLYTYVFFYVARLYYSYFLRTGLAGLTLRLNRAAGCP